jgi:hypothetical protein
MQGGGGRVVIVSSTSQSVKKLEKNWQYIEHPV